MAERLWGHRGKYQRLKSGGGSSSMLRAYRLELANRVTVSDGPTFRRSVLNLAARRADEHHKQQPSSCTTCPDRSACRPQYEQPVVPTSSSGRIRAVAIHEPYW